MVRLLEVLRGGGHGWWSSLVMVLTAGCGLVLNISGMLGNMHQWQ